MTRPWVMDNKCVKYYPDPTWQWGVMAGHIFSVYVQWDIRLRDMTLGQGHYTRLGHDQQSCEISSWFNLAVRRYGPDTDFENVCTVTLEILPCHDTPLDHGQQLCEILSRCIYYLTCLINRNPYLVHMQKIQKIKTNLNCVRLKSARGAIRIVHSIYYIICKLYYWSVNRLVNSKIWCGLLNSNEHKNSLNDVFQLFIWNMISSLWMQAT